MRKFLAALAFLAALIPASGLGQQFPLTLPANTVYGRLGIGTGPGQAIPFTTLALRLSSAGNVINVPAACNGVTDDTAVIAAAIGNAPAGGVWQMPPGTCIVSNININKPGVFRGAGLAGLSAANASTVIKGNSASSAVISITAANGGVRLQDLGVTSSVAVGSRTGSGVLINAGPSVLIERVYSTGHLRGFESRSPGVEFHFTNSSLNSGAGYLFDGTVSAQNEIGLYSAASNLNSGDGFLVNGPATGIWGYRLISAGNGGTGFKALRVGAGFVNDVYLTDPEISMNTGTAVDFSNNSAGIFLTIEGGLIEATATLVHLGTGFSGVAIKGVTMGDHGTGVFNNAADVVISGNIIQNSSVVGIELGPTSTGAIVTNNKSKGQGATPLLALNVDVGAGSFIGTDNDWSSATTARAGGGGIPAGSIYCNNKGDPVCLRPNIAAPATPAAANVAIWTDTTDKRLHDKNDAGTIGTTVVADAGAANNFLTAISAAGVISKAQPSVSNISGFGTGVATALGNAASGSGGPCLTTSCVMTTPTLGTATFTGLQNGTGSASGNNVIAVNIASATGRFESFQNSLGEAIFGIDSAGNATFTLNSGTVGTIFGTATAAPTDVFTNNVRRLRFASTAAHFAPNGTAPALTACGTSPAITGTDVAGTVTMGTGTPTGCVITFNAAYAAAPQCTVTWRATPLASQSYAVSTAAITLTQTATSSNVVDYHCWGG